MSLRKFLFSCYVYEYGEIITMELARGLVQEMAITDGSRRKTGEKFSPEEAKSLANAIGMELDDASLPEFYLVINLMYSDYFCIGKNNDLFYANLSRAWLEDVDAVENKTFKYFIA